MPTNLTEFEDDTAFERYVLDRATPLMPRSSGSTVIELQGSDSTSLAVEAQPAMVHVGADDSSGSGEHRLSPDDIRPLLFGAAWKVLDQLIELGLEQMSFTHDLKWRYSIGLKVREAGKGTVRPVPPFDGRPDLWTRVLKSYAATADLRNSLAHRRLTVDRSTGSIAGAARPNTIAQMNMTADEQSAICRVAEGVADAVINGALSSRRMDQLSWVLDQLTSLHKQSLFGTSPALGRIPMVIVRSSPTPSGVLTLDFGSLRARARAAVGDVSHLRPGNPSIRWPGAGRSP
jgi:hypothetical protein